MEPEKQIVDTPQKITLNAKSSRGRKAGAVAFPRNSLNDALRVAKSIWNDNAGRPFPLGDLANQLNYSPTSSSFRDLVRSANRYGLIEGSWIQDTTKTIDLTPLGTSIVAPKVDEDPNAFLRKALEIPEVFRDFLNSINGRVIPPEDVCKSTLMRVHHIIKSDVDACYNVLMKNIEELNITLENTPGKRYLRLDKLSANLPVSQNAEEISDLDNSDEIKSIDEVESIDEEPEPKKEEKPKQIFVAHGKNRKPLEQLKGILDQFNVAYKVAIDEANQGRPVSQKVSELMQECSSAIFLFTKDEETKDLEDNTVYRPSDNVVYELGAASVLYGKKIVIFKQDGVSFGSDFKDLGYISFDDNQLDAKAMDLMKELVGFGILKVSAT